MRGLARLCLIGLLALLLPLKGVAAAGYMAAVQHGTAHEQAAPAHAHPGDHPCHEAGDRADDEASAVEHAGHATCKHCAPCCAPVAPMMAFELAPLVFDAPQPPAAMPSSWPALALPLPDRPPRA